MKTIEQINEEIDKLELLKKGILSKKINLKLNKKEFKIIKWENKEIEDFIMPEGWDFAEHSDFIELFDEKLIDLPGEGWEFYFVKHYSKRKQKEGLLSRVCLDWCGYLSSMIGNIVNSGGFGRVVISRCLK